MLTKAELAGTAEVQREEKALSTEAQGGGAAGSGGSRAGNGMDGWRSIGDIAGALMDKLQAAAEEAGLGGVREPPRRQLAPLH